MRGAYREDLARIHDEGFGALASSAAPVLLGALSLAGLSAGLVVDLGCGSGLLSQELSAAGYDVLGVDVSGPMLAIARRRVPRGLFRQESLLDTRLPRCVAVAAVGESFNYLFDERNSRGTLLALFRRIHRALVPGGVLLFDMATPRRVASSAHLESRDWAVLVTAERSRTLLTRRITTFRRLGALYRRSHEVHRLRLVSRAEAVRLLREAGFRVRVLAAYASVRLPPGLAAYLAHKPRDKS